MLLPDLDPPSLPDIARLMGRHFAESIPSTKKQLRCKCIVCVSCETLIAKRHNTPKGRRIGNKTQFQCKQCHVALCIQPCFKYYHVYTDYVQKYCMDFDE